MDRRQSRIPLLLIAVLSLTCALTGSGATAATVATVAPPAVVPSPTVTGPIPATAPPGDASHDYPYVYWEIAGASHSDRHAFLVSNPIRLRDAGVSGLPAGPTAPCVLPARSNVPYEYVLDAMFDHIVAWGRDGVQPPAGPRIEVTDLGTQPVTVARDPYQIIRGGIRLAAVDVPTERDTGLTPADNSRCAQGGAWVPFDDTTLRALYPTHAGYVAAVRRVTEQNLRMGFLVPEDAAATIRDAENSRIGRL